MEPEKVAETPSTVNQSSSLIAPIESTQGVKLSLAEFPKYVAVVGSVLYTFGFLIWYSYLAQYGLSPSSLWKIEFFSASLCYFTILFGISFPVTLIVGRFLHGRPDLKFSVDFMKAGNIAIYPLFLLSAFLCTQIVNLFFGGWVSMPMKYHVVQLVVMILLAFHLTAHIIFRIRKNTGRFARIVQNDTIIGGYFLIGAMVPLVASDRADGLFLSTTALLYLSVGFMNGLDLAAYWKSFSPHLKVLAVACGLFLLMTNARQFAVRQFGKIPQSVGGGEPLRALLVLGQDQQPLASLLGMDVYQETNHVITTSTNSLALTNLLFAGAKTNLPSTHSLYGPISILTRSEREIVFFLPVQVGTNSARPHAKIIRADQIQGVEFLNTR